MYIVVSNDRRVPIDLEKNKIQIEQWNLDEFYNNATSDDGLTIDEGIYYDVSVLTQEIYESLLEYREYNINIVYYRFDDMPTPSFKMQDDITVYATKQPESDPEPEPEPEPIIEEVISPTPEPDPEPERLDLNKSAYVPPVSHASTPVYAASPIQPVVSQQSIQATYQQPIVQSTYPQPIAPSSTQQNYQLPINTQPIYQQPVEPVSNYTSADESHSSNKKKNTKDSNTEKSLDKSAEKIMKMNLNNLLQHDDFDAENRRRKKKAPARVVLFGSSKGGTGKTFTCLASAYWYAKKHPIERVALADFDIIDGQIGITINKLSPTMQEYYKLYMSGRKEFSNLENCKVKTEHFSPNIDFYLAPSQDIPQITDNITFWNELFMSLINNYDVVFFDSGIDYLGKPPISQLYKIADKIIITTNPSINSVKSVIKQMKTLSGNRTNEVFKPSDKILKRVNLVITRMYEDGSLNDVVMYNLQKFAPVVAVFGNIDKIISEIQWYQHWYLIDSNPKLYSQLEKIVDLKNIDDEE